MKHTFLALLLLLPAVSFANDEFVVYLQPVVDLPARRVSAYEALVRWDHPTRGTLTPDAFVPSAEELGLIDQVDRIVIAKTIEMLAEHENARPIAVNLSARTFSDPQLVAWLATRLHDAGVGSDRLVATTPVGWRRARTFR